MAQQTDHIGDINEMVNMAISPPLKTNNMKLYTEEQVRDMLHEMKCKHNLTDEQIEYWIEDMISIELPSDEDRINKFNDFISTEVALKFLTKEQGERLKWYHETYLNR